METNSVYDLITLLCQNLIKNTDPKIVKKFRSQAFEILLKKSHYIEENRNLDPHKTLGYFLFELQSTSESLNKRNCEEYKTCIDEIWRNPYFHENHGLSELNLLIALKDSSTDPDIISEYNLLFPKSSKIIEQFNTSNLKNNPYIPSSDHRTSCFKLNELPDIKKKPQKYFEPGKLVPALLNGSSEILSDEDFENDHHNDCVLNEQPEIKYFSGMNWENLGHDRIPVELSLATELESIHYIRSIEEQKKSLNFTPKIISVEDFLRDLKSLTVAVKSESFTISEQLVFVMQENLTIKNVSPETLKEAVRDLIECGTCFKRLQILIEKNPYNFKHIFEGFVFKALCSSIEKYLTMFTRFVMSYHDLSIVQFKLRVSNLAHQIITIAKTFGIHPSSSSDYKLPIGSDFLGFLYNEITQVTKQDILMLYIFMLRQCCQMYFIQLQKWIFNGYLYDPSKELFIYHVEYYRPNTKPFFDKAYLIRNKSVPEFLQGYEENILLCGKYTMLLKAFNHTHPIFSLNPPPLTVCLSFEKIEQLAEQCRIYKNNALELCGDLVSVEKIFQQKNEKKKLFKKNVEKRFKDNLEKWKLEQETKQKEEHVEKQKRLIELKKQMEEHRELKLAERVAEIAEEKFYIQQGIEMEEKQIAQENLQIQKRIEYYKELNQLAVERNNLVENKLKKLKIEDKSVTDINPDVMAMSQTSETFMTPEDGIFTLQVEIPKEPSKIIAINKDEESTNENIDIPTDIKRSSSDYFNANVVDEFCRNKKKSLGSTINEDTLNILPNAKTKTLTQTEKNRIQVLQEELNCYQNCDNNIIESNTNLDGNLNELTEAQKNKIKVLGHEFGIKVIEENDILRNENGEMKSNRNKNMKQSDMNPIDIYQNNRNETAELKTNRKKNTAHQNFGDEILLDELKPVPPSHPLSARQTNRNKVMKSNFDKEYDDDDDIIIIEINNAELTDLQKNRIKVMTQEFNILKPDSPPIVKKYLNLDLDRVKNKRKVLESEYHIITGTPMSTGSDITPIQDFDVSKVDGPDDFHVLKKFGVPDTAVLNEVTPESALISKTGFNFPLNDSQAAYTSNINNLEAVSCLRYVNEAITHRKSNFFPLAMDITDDDDEDYINNHGLSQSELKNINVTTLTKFLQLSVIIPLNSHLEILNNEILKIFLNDLNILDHFRSLRNYLFLMDGEFGSYICDGLISRLESETKPSTLLNFHTLHMLLENALGSSILGNDKNSNGLSFFVDQIPDEFDKLSPDVLSNLTLSYQVTWPLNLILNNETLQQYGNIFRYLIKVRRISWLLEESFQILKNALKEVNQAIIFSPQYLYVQQIRHKLSLFIMTLQNHITSNALQAAWKTFKDDLINVKTMEDLYRKHINYIKRILFLCMLNRKSIDFHNNIEDIFKVILKFCYHLKSRTWKKVKNNLDFTHSKFSKMQQDESDFENLLKYTIYLGNKIVRRGYQKEIGDFINLINFNGYYDKIDVKSS